MSQQGTAKAGHGGSTGSGGDSGPAKDDLAAEGARASRAGTGPSAEQNEASAFGSGQSEAEEQLHAFLDLMTNTKPASGFPPLDELNARLNEEPYRDSLLFPHSDDSLMFGPSEDDPWPELQSVPLNGPQNGLGWLGSRFDELKQLLAKKDEGLREIEQIKASLGQILIRLEKISAEMPKGTTLALVDNKLTALSGSLDAAREQSSVDANRISRAAKEILAASARIQETPMKFEAAAQQTVEGLGHTGASRASRPAAMMADPMNARPCPPGEISPIDRLENELRTLNRQSRESGERTAAALDRVNSTLLDYLDRSPAASRGTLDAPPPPPRRRTGLHVPISGNSAVYKRGGTGFGAAPATEPRLDSIQLRNPPPSHPDFFEALREANQRYSKKMSANKPQPNARAEGMEPAFAGTPAFLEEEKNVPLGGIAAVAFILLLVSAALFYLHTKDRSEGVRIPAPAAAAVQQRVPVPLQPVRTATAPKQGIQRDGAALMAAANEIRGSQVQGEGLETLLAAAGRGDPEAQFRIGMRFLNDSKLEGGPAAAARWFAKAARQGHSEAQFQLASMLERGEGMAKDEAVAIELYQQAAGAGHERAMHNLGAMLVNKAEAARNGGDTGAAARSYHDAAGWFERAAEQGFADSQYNLALLYEYGLGIEQDLSRAYQWYVLAAKAGVKEAAEKVERLRRTMPSAQNAPSGGQAIQGGSWRPVLESTKKSASIEGAAKG